MPGASIGRLKETKGLASRSGQQGRPLHMVLAAMAKGQLQPGIGTCQEGQGQGAMNQQHREGAKEKYGPPSMGGQVYGG